jgi:hypothetical protein
MATKLGWVNQLTTELATAKRKVEAAQHHYGLALLLCRVEPDLKGVNELVVAARSMAYVARVNADNAEMILEAGIIYIGDDGQISDIQQGRLVAATAKEIDELRSIMREGSVEAMQVRLAAKVATS